MAHRLFRRVALLLTAFSPVLAAPISIGSPAFTGSETVITADYLGAGEVFAFGLFASVEPKTATNSLDPFLTLPITVDFLPAVIRVGFDIQANAGDVIVLTAFDPDGNIPGASFSWQKSEAILTLADKYGMEVSEAQVKLLDGKESLVKARLALHTFQEKEVRQPVDAGLAIARDTFHAGAAALHEKDVRRYGLAVSVVCISTVIVAIWLLIRRLEPGGETPGPGDAPST